jgi:hypothetical protein
MHRSNIGVEDQELPASANQARANRRRLVIGGLAAVVAIGVLGIALWIWAAGGDEAAAPPAEARDSTRSTDLAAAEGLAAAFAKQDAAGAAPYLAPGTEAPWPEWRVHMQRDAAWGIDNTMQPCRVTASTSFSTDIACPFAFHLLGSREVGKGPFPDNVLEVSVRDGKVTSAHRVIPYETNGVGDHLDSVMAWLGKSHPESEAFLTKDEMDVKPAEWPTWTRLWKQYTQEYIAATNKSG